MNNQEWTGWRNKLTNFERKLCMTQALVNTGQKNHLCFWPETARLAFPEIPLYYKCESWLVEIRRVEASNFKGFRINLTENLPDAPEHKERNYCVIMLNENGSMHTVLAGKILQDEKPELLDKPQRWYPNSVNAIQKRAVEFVDAAINSIRSTRREVNPDGTFIELPREERAL